MLMVLQKHIGNYIINSNADDIGSHVKRSLSNVYMNKLIFNIGNLV